MKDILAQGARQFGIELTDAALDDFMRYRAFLEEKNRVMNLTTINGEKNVAQLHFLDSLAVMTAVPVKHSSIIDIGSGAGFPGLPIKIAEPSTQLTLLDAQDKRIAFLRELAAYLKLDGVQCLHARAEEAALTSELRDSFNIAVSRAVARLNVLSELCLPFVQVGGAFIAMKGTDSDEEIREAEKAVTALGGEMERIFDYEIPGTDVRHRLVVIRKKAATPSGYPRRFAKIQKQPL